MNQEIKQFHEGDENTKGNHKILIFILFALFLVVCVIVFGYYFLNGRGQEIVNDNKDIMQVEQVSNIEVDSEKETPFEKNEYVKQFYSAEKNVLRIPYEFLVSKNVDGYEFYGDDDKFYKLDLNEHPLPLNNLVSFVVSPDSKKIAYMVYDGEDYCENKKGYIYDIDTKESVEIDDSKTLNACGAVSASISHFSSGGRFLYIHVGGPGSSQYFLYDSYKKVGEYNEDSIIYGDNEEYIIYTEGSDGSTCSIDSVPGCLNDIVKWENLDTEEERVLFDIDGESGYVISDFHDGKLSVKKFKQRSRYRDYEVIEVVVDDNENTRESSEKYENKDLVTKTMDLGIVKITFPSDYNLSFNKEKNRRGSFLSYDFQSTNYQIPHLSEIQFFSEESIKTFTSKCEGENSICFFGDYPTNERYLGQKNAFINKEKYLEYELVNINDIYYFVSNYRCMGDRCIIRKYTTFVDDVKIDISISMEDNTQIVEADKLFEKFSIIENTDFKIYKNDEYGFKFDYPNYLEIKNNPNIEIDNIQEFRNLENDCLINLDFCANPTPLISVSYDNNYTEDLSGEKISFNGVEFFKTTAGEMYESEAYTIKKDNTLISFRFYIKEEGLTQIQIEKILSTFKFVK